MSIEKLLAQNFAWSERIRGANPSFFERLEEQQSPKYLWIGCSDSRVPANQILDLAPGEIFVHRNIANLVVRSDLNSLSVVQFAVDILKVRQIMVVGHYGCGGVRAAMEGQRLGLVDNWLRHVQEVKEKHAGLLVQFEPEHRLDRLCELNVAEQFLSICQTTVMQDAWKRGQHVSVHGLIYSLHDGVLREIGLSANSSSAATDAYVDMVRVQNAVGANAERCCVEEECDEHAH